MIGSEHMLTFETGDTCSHVSEKTSQLTILGDSLCDLYFARKTVNNKLLLGKKITVTFYLKFHDKLPSLAGRDEFSEVSSQRIFSKYF